MSEQRTGGIHWSFWVVGIISLLWNTMGCINFFAQLNPEVLANYRESERMIVEGRPLWATAAFALAVFGGALGSILLLVRRAVSYQVFVASLLGVIVTMIYTLGSGINFGAGEIFGIILLPLVVAAFLPWYAKRATSRHWCS